MLWEAPLCCCTMQDPRQEAAISALHELYEQLSRVLKPRRPSGLTVLDHVGDTQKRKHWCGPVCLQCSSQPALAA